MKSIGTYANHITTARSFEDTIRRVTELLQGQGFGILCDIDVQATLRAKLGLASKPYRILGACNPALAHRVLETEPHSGVFLPCNVVVWDEGSHRVVAAMEPLVMAGIIEDDTVRRVAAEVSGRLKNVLEQVE